MVKKWKDLLANEERPMEERLFTLITIVLAIAFAVFIVVNAVTGATAGNTLILLGGLVLYILIAVLSVRSGRIRLGAGIISALLIFALLPYTYFTGGGIYGGAPLWFVFSALLVSLILTGKARVFFLAAELVVAAVCYFLAYHNPDLVARNAVTVAYIDSYAALLVLSLAVAVMIGYEIVLFRQENRRAERQKQEIEALNVAQNRFFSSMSHEIRTPINTIIGLNEMILREEVSEEVAEDAANIQTASRMLLHLINDILDMSKLESGSMVLTPVEYRIGDMISELVSMFAGRAKEKGLEFRVSVAPEVPAELFGDDVRIKQILINVLNNAIKYTGAGSVSFSVQCAAREGSTQNLLFSVSDTGVGIKKESIPYLFTAFKRVDEEQNRKIEGTGLGLNIVKQLVDLMGGTVTVNSIYTQGSTFLIELPQQVLGEETVGALDLGARSGGSRKAYRARYEAPGASVLVVDDNSSNLLVVSKLLRSTKVKVTTASSGDEALRLTQEKAFDVIFMDHMMPGMDGVECRRRILEQPGGKCRESKVIALTANADGESRALYEREGFDGFLMKPIDGDALERELYHQLPADLVRTFAAAAEDLVRESVAWIQTPERKRMVAVATESVADLPREMLEQYEIATIPHLILTGHGVFRDTLDLEADGLLGFMADPDHNVRTATPDVAALEAFFAAQLKRANHVVFIALSPKVGNSAYPAALEAAKSFNNVTVIDSGHLSSGQGLLVLEACRLAEDGKTPAEIATRLEDTKKLIQTSFIVDNLDYLCRAGQVGGTLARITKGLMMRPVLALKDGSMDVGRVYLGSRRRAWEKYIEAALCIPTNLDPRLLFITYSGLTRQELNWVLEQVQKSEVAFQKICFQKASAAIAVNCGPHTFGLLYRTIEPK